MAPKPVLTPLILQNAEVLRSLRDSTYATVAELAEELGRDRSNLAKSLKALEAAGLIGPCPQLTLAALRLDGLAAAAALDRADRIDADGAPAEPMPAGFALLSLREIIPDPLNPRKHFDEEAIAELAESIARDQLLENLVVRPHPLGTVLLGRDEADRETRTPLFTIVAGERRWRAMQLLAEQGRWDYRAPTVPCKIVEIDDAAHRRIALVENLQRKDLRPIDEAQALQDLMKVTGQSTAEVAKEIGFTQRFVQQRLQLLGLPDTVQDQVNAGEVTIEKARAMAAVLPDLPADKAKALTAGKITPEDAKRWLDNRPKLLDDITPRQWLMLLEVADASARANGELTQRVSVGAQIAEDADWAALKARGAYFVAGPSPTWEQGFEVGRYVILPSYCDGLTQLRMKYGDALEDDAGRAMALAQARADAGVEFALAMEPAEYTIPWLNGPFEIPADLQAQIDQAKADRAAATRREEAERAEDARRKGEAFNVAQSILVQHRKRDLPTLDARYVEAFDAFDIELPVTVDPDGNVLDANGQTLVRSGWGHGNAPPPVIGRNTLLALAINAAAGLHTPDHPTPADPDVLPQAEFLEIVAGCLIEDVDDLTLADARTMAERGLKAFLARPEGIEYGDPAHDWQEDGAMDIAQAIREDGLGQTPADADALETEEA